MKIKIKQAAWYTYAEILKAVKTNFLKVSARSLCDTNSAGKKCGGAFGMNIANKLSASGYTAILI
jgi:hypothetical protein